MFRGYEELAEHNKEQLKSFLVLALFDAPWFSQYPISTIDLTLGGMDFESDERDD